MADLSKVHGFGLRLRGPGGGGGGVRVYRNCIGFMPGVLGESFGRNFGLGFGRVLFCALSLNLLGFLEGGGGGGGGGGRE